MTDSAPKCKSFVSEAEIEAIKLKRQEEWEKVRKPDDPIEAPEEEYDPRSLYDRLQEQKDRREAEIEEGKRLKNLIKGLDDDEVSFLELVDKSKIENEAKLWEEERKELMEFRKAVSNLAEEEQETKLHQMRQALKLKSSGSSEKSQRAMLAGALKRKASSSTSPEPKRKTTLANGNTDESSSEPVAKTLQVPVAEGGLVCLGILPGLGAYTDSSDSDNSSDSEIEKGPDYDLVGRRYVEVVQEEPKKKRQQEQCQ